jgi:tetratricopeptide (TPR) repeat protein
LAVVGVAILSSTSLDVRTSAATRHAAAEEISKYACLLKSQRRFDDALEAIRRAHALAPESAKITAEVGFYLHAARRYDEELPMLQRAVGLDDGSPDAWFHLGLGYARREDLDHAIPALRRAVELSPDDGPYQWWLDWAIARTGGPGRGGGFSGGVASRLDR